MTYREQLNKVNKLGINICDLEVANEFDTVLDFDYTEEQFESLCAFGVNVWKADYQITYNDIAYYVNILVKEEGKTVEDIISMNVWDFIDNANDCLGK